MSNQGLIYFNISENNSLVFHRGLHFCCYRNMWGFQSMLKGELFHLKVCPLPLWGRLAGTTALNGSQSGTLTTDAATLTARLPFSFSVPLCSAHLHPCFLPPLQSEDM